MSSFSTFDKKLILSSSFGAEPDHVTISSGSTNNGSSLNSSSTRQSSNFFSSGSTNSSHIYRHQGLEFTIDPQVFSPENHASSAWYTQQLANQNLAGKEMIEVGCGSGFTGQYLVKKHGLARLTAVDVCLPAVACATKNSERLNIADRVSVRHSDVFDNVPSNTNADVIYWNHPWLHVREGWVFKNDRDRALYDPEYGGLAKYLRDAEKHLKLNGRIFLGFNTKSGNRQVFRQRLEEHGYAAVAIAKGDSRVNGHGRGAPVLYELVRPSSVPAARIEGKNL